ncbi:hypothetical protein [Enterococcus sp. AZ109]|uniref:hypothetical protein n=1 Tax=Enterococcus sp. AZ109 TaxID=2774634 RepID=UPI003F29AC6D
MSKEKKKKYEEIFGEVQEVTTYGEWVDCWILELSLMRKASSIAIYQRTLNKYLLPALGDYKLEDLTPKIINKAIDEWIANYARPTVVLNNLSMLNRTLKAAIREGLLSENPCDDINWTVLASQKSKRMSIFSS